MKKQNSFPMEPISYNVTMKSLRFSRRFHLIEELAYEMIEKSIKLDNITYSTTFQAPASSPATVSVSPCPSLLLLFVLSSASTLHSLIPHLSAPCILHVVVFVSHSLSSLALSASSTTVACNLDNFVSSYSATPACVRLSFSQPPPSHVHNHRSHSFNFILDSLQSSSAGAARVLSSSVLGKVEEVLSLYERARATGWKRT